MARRLWLPLTRYQAGDRMAGAAKRQPAGYPQRVRIATVDLSVDLFGEQTVQVAATALSAAMMLLAGALLMVLSVHWVRSAMPKPMLARVPQRTGRLVLPESSDLSSELGRQTSLPTRGPPDWSLYSHAAEDPPGDLLSG